MILKVKKEQLKYVATERMLEEEEPPRFIKASIFFILFLVLAFVIWAAFTDIKETAITYGEVVPESKVHIVQHLEGGVVGKILVKNGDKVSAGDPLIVLDTTNLESELLQMKNKEVSLMLDAQRLHSLLKWESITVNDWIENIKSTGRIVHVETEEFQNLLRDEQILFSEQLKKRKDQLHVLDAQVEQGEQDLIRIKGELKVVQEHIALLREEGKIYDSLIEGGHVSKKEYLSSKRQRNKAEGEEEKLKSELTKASIALEETKSRKDKMMTDFNEKVLQELDEINEKLLEVKQLITRLESRVKKTTIRAPLEGVVHNLLIVSGMVIAPGGVLLEIVPGDHKLLVESRVNPLDIGHIRVGDSVTVKVLTYDFSRYGSINGTLDNISADTLQDEKGYPYYKAIIKLEKQHVGNNEDMRIIPGMTVEASIITGDKSLLAYILKPVRNAVTSGFRER